MQEFNHFDFELNGIIRTFLRTAVNDFMDSVHHIWCPLSSQEYQDQPDGAEMTLTVFPTDDSVKKVVWLAIWASSLKWTMPLKDWRMAMSLFIIEFGDRLDGHFRKRRLHKMVNRLKKKQHIHPFSATDQVYITAALSPPPSGVARQRVHLPLEPVYKRYRSGFSDRQSRFCRWMAGMYIVNLASCMCYTGRFSYRTQEVISETSCQYGSRYTLTNGGGAIEQPFPVYVSYPVFAFP